MRNAPHSLLLLSSLTVTAGAQENCFPLAESAPVTSATEGTNPFVTPARVTQTLIVDRNTLVAQGLTDTLINWDMVAFSPDSRFIFIPAENFAGGGGLFRYDTQTGGFVEIFTGNNQGPDNRNSDPSTFDHTTDETNANDPCTWTPHGTIIFGEESVGGRFFELMNPLDPTGPFDVQWRTSIPSVRHEGMRFDNAGNLYFVDESNSGCIYRFVPNTVGDLTAGQTFCLSIDAYANDPNAVPTENFDSAANQLTTRQGVATWVPITGPNGQQITPTDPFEYVLASGGQSAADEVFGTPFGRPEDIDVGVLANGNGVVYVALTSENRVLSIELIDETDCMVRDFVNFDTINLATGTDVNPTQQDPFTSPGSDTENNFDDPDNLTVGPDGAVYILEDETPGDIWKAIDVDGDGVAEHMGLFMSLSTTASEPTGMIFDPNNPYRAICNIQHPASGNDALWAFDTLPYDGSDPSLEVATGINSDPTSGPGEFVRCAVANDLVNIDVSSDDPQLAGAIYVLFTSAFDTVAGTPATGPVWLTRPATRVNIGLLGGNDDSFTVPIPTGLSGMSLMVQGVAFRLGTGIVYSDATEIQID